MTATIHVSHETVLRIARSHPSLPGHFPGRPLVPGVVLLDCVLQEAERWLGRPLAVRGLPLAKFTAPLLPEQDARLVLQATRGGRTGPGAVSGQTGGVQTDGIEDGHVGRVGDIGQVGQVGDIGELRFRVMGPGGILAQGTFLLAPGTAA